MRVTYYEPTLVRLHCDLCV